MLFNGRRTLIFSFSVTQVRISEIERLQSLFKVSMGRTYSNSCLIVGDSGGVARGGRGEAGWQCHQYAVGPAIARSSTAHTVTFSTKLRNDPPNLLFDLTVCQLT